eukprot:TRINITY_DN90815_c0_g1_i1.p2 TRINITY_DN90815_c0_g1~~TRINITY_DN90815_c0_g1_i1.p2  ORF type:complete len:143 (+),score=31.32 TRINITY_DN90815_c0_g1_i1:39-431(+)
MGTSAPESELRPGVNVVIHGLKGAADLNGKEATVKTWDADKGRWTVQLQGGDFKALKPENLQPKKTTDAMPGWVVGAMIAVGVVAFVLQSGMAQSGTANPVGYVTELFQPFDPPPPQAPKDTVVISFCQG